MRKTHFIPVATQASGVSERVKALLRRAIRTALSCEGVTLPCEVDVLVTDDRGIRKLNRLQRGVDRPTDVLSFPALELQAGAPPTAADAEAGTGLIPLGDVAISYERAAAQAKEYGHAKSRELAYLVTHSVLHLLGYDHMDEGAQKALMRAHEERVMTELELKR